MNEKNNENKGFAAFLGRLVGHAILLCIATCVMSVLIAASYVFVRWILGVIL